MIFSSSDWHSPPDGLPQKVKEWIRSGKELNSKLIVVGDAFDLVIYGVDKYRNSIAVNDLIECLDGYNLDFICGNHDPIKFVTKLNLPPNINVVKRVDVKFEGMNWHFEHGHRLGGWGTVGKIIPTFTNFMAEHFPKSWYLICKRMGWLASSLKSNGEREKYSKLIGLVHSAYLEYIEKNKVNCVIGHTHRTFASDVWTNSHKFTLLDCGNIGDGSYCLIGKVYQGIDWL